MIETHMISGNALSTKSTKITQHRGDTTAGKQPIGVAVVIAEHQALVRMGLRLLVQLSPSLEVVGESVDGHETVALVNKLKPAILLSEVELPRLHLFDVLAALQGSKTKTIVVSGVEDELTIAECLRLGAMGYVFKRSSFEEVEFAVASVMGGEVYLCTEATQVMMAAMKESLSGIQKGTMALTKRELIVMQLAATGKTSAEIATALFISTRTAEAHRANAMKKMGIHTQTELVKHALKKKWLTP